MILRDEKITRKAKDLTGQTFGRLTVLEKVDPYISPSGHKAIRYSCKCVCGNVVTVNSLYLTNGRTRSCGCIRRENGRKQAIAYADTKTNRYEFDGDVGKCYFSNTDGYFLFDAEDYELLKKYTWNFVSHKIRAFSHRTNNIRQYVCLARLLMNCPKGLIVDHINHDLLDNRKSNLRICTKAQSRVRSRLRKDNKTGYIGVHQKQLLNGDYRYTADICVNGKQTYLGTYKTPEEAYKVRLEAEKTYYGEFATDRIEEGEKKE